MYLHAEKCVGLKENMRVLQIQKAGLLQGSLMQMIQKDPSSSIPVFPYIPASGVLFWVGIDALLP